jgi:general secretion pathway protein L
MQEKLVIYLHANDPALIGWAVVKADGVIGQSAYQDNAEGLASIAEGKQVIVLVPTEDVLILTTTLPKMSRSRLAEALPFALEEQLITEVDTLHFASGQQRADGELSVMVVAHQKMQQWLQSLQAWGLRADMLLPVCFALPLEENTWHCMISDMAVVRSGIDRGFACDRANLNAMLELHSQACPHLPTHLVIQNYSNHAFSTALDMPVSIQETFVKTDEMMPALARHVVNDPIMNLLQGRYAAKKSPFPQVGKMWKLTTYLAMAFVALLFLSPVVSYLILRQRVVGIETQIVQIYKRQFPQASSIVAPKLRMEEKLQKMTAQAGESRLLALLGYVGKGMLETPSIKLKRVDFQHGQLTVELTAATSDDFAAFTDFLTQQGLAVKQQNANLSGERINATLEIGG